MTACTTGTAPAGALATACTVPERDRVQRDHKPSGTSKRQAERHQLHHLRAQPGYHRSLPGWYTHAPAGKYVVEVVVPPGYELVKEEDKNILIGDNYIAPATTQFAGLGNIFILPDQAEVAALYNANNAQNPTQTLGRTTFPSSEGDTGSVEVFWPCVGALRTVPDFISLFPQSGEVSPFAGAQRHLCDRKEVTLNEQESALAKFWISSLRHTSPLTTPASSRTTTPGIRIRSRRSSARSSRPRIFPSRLKIGLVPKFRAPTPIIGERTTA